MCPQGPRAGTPTGHQRPHKRRFWSPQPGAGTLPPCLTVSTLLTGKPYVDHSMVTVPPGSHLHLHCLQCQPSSSLSRPWATHRLVCAHSATNLRKDSTELGSEAAFLSPVTGPQDTAGVGPLSFSVKHTVGRTCIAGQEDPIREKDVQRGQGGREGTFHVE